MALLDSVLFLDEYFNDKKINQSLAWRDVRSYIMDNRQPTNNKQSTPLCSCGKPATVIIKRCDDCDAERSWD